MGSLSCSSYKVVTRLHLSASPLPWFLLKSGVLQAVSHHVPLNSKTGPWLWLRYQLVQVVASSNAFRSASATLTSSITQRKASSSRQIQVPVPALSNGLTFPHTKEQGFDSASFLLPISLLRESSVLFEYTIVYLYVCSRCVTDSACVTQQGNSSRLES